MSSDGTGERNLSGEDRVSRHMARLYHYIARTLKEEIGRSETERILEKAVWRYGEHCGRQAREETLARGEDPDSDASGGLIDLCAVGPQVKDADGDVIVTSCLLADEWRRLGDMDLTRLYCLAHQAKYRAYNPKILCEYLQNQLDGNEQCRLHLRVLQDATEQPPPPGSM